MEHWENSVKFKEWKKVLIKNNIKINSIQEKYSVGLRSWLLVVNEIIPL